MTCRRALGCEWGGEEDGPLLQLCACRGSAKLVHRHCLETWRRTSDKEDAAYRCGECKDEYRDALSLELLSARLQAERAYGQVTGLTLNTLASELQVQGKYDEAEPLCREVLDLARATLGDRHPNTRSPPSITYSARCCRIRATSLPPSRCCAWRWSYGARPTAIGTQTRSIPWTNSAGC